MKMPTYIPAEVRIGTNAQNTELMLAKSELGRSKNFIENATRRILVRLRSPLSFKSLKNFKILINIFCFFIIIFI